MIVEKHNGYLIELIGYRLFIAYNGKEIYESDSLTKLKLLL